MNEPTDIQTIMQDGKPAIGAIPFDEYLRLFPKAPRFPQGDAIPHEVVGLTVKKGYTLVRAWREYLRLTQAEIAERRGNRDVALIPGFAHVQFSFDIGAYKAYIRRTTKGGQPHVKGKNEHYDGS
jgi:hypothetical protein